MTLKHSQRSPVTFNEKQMLVKACWNELLFSRWFDSLTYTKSYFWHEKALYGVDMIYNHKHLCVWFSDRAPYFLREVNFCRQGPTVRGCLKKLPQRKGKGEFSKPEIHKGLILLKIQAFYLCDQEAFYLLTGMSIHLPMRQPEITEMILALAVSYLGTTDFSGTLCLVIQTWTACSYSVLLS